MTNNNLAFVFPGQGSQAVGMLSELADRYPQVNDKFKQASDALGYDLWDIVQNNPDDKLNQTQYTQPALLAAGVAAWDVYKSLGKDMPAYLAGHSLGEYTALVCAGVIEFADAIKLVAARGQFMQEAVAPGEGAMAAIIGLDEAGVIQLCDELSQGEILAPANYNSLGQIVIAGQAPAVGRAVANAKAKGAKLAKIIPVSVPSHSPMMKPAAEKLKSMMSDMTFSSPQIPVINNADVKMESDSDMIKDALVRQLYMPVRWVETTQLLVEKGVTNITECGPGKVLVGLIKRINKTLELSNFSNPSDI